MLMFFPSMETESMQMLANAKLEGIDPALLKALGMSVVPDFTIITNYFGYVLQFITLAIIVVIAQQAISLFIKEETDGTIEYLCAKPVSRNEIFFQKLLALLVYVIFMLTSFFVVTVVGYMLVTDYSFGESVGEAAILFGAIFFVALVFSAIGVLLSTLIKSNKGAAGITIGIVFGTFILGIMSVVVKELDFLIWFSPIDWIKSEKLMSEGILLQEWIVGIAVIVIATGAACLHYRRKDLLI
jgi:ABC-2 type transport system permease protein